MCGAVSVHKERRESDGGEMRGGCREEGGRFASGCITLMGHKYCLTPVENVVHRVNA